MNKMYIETLLDTEDGVIINYRNANHPIMVEDGLFNILQVIKYLCKDPKNFPSMEDDWEECPWGEAYPYRENVTIWSTISPVKTEDNVDYYGIIYIEE